jgi:hypothetical protein
VGSEPFGAQPAEGEAEEQTHEGTTYQGGPPGTLAAGLLKHSLRRL